MKPSPHWPPVIRDKVAEFPLAVQTAVIEGINLRVQVAANSDGGVCFEGSGEFDGSPHAFYVWARFCTESDLRVITDFGGDLLY